MKIELKERFKTLFQEVNKEVNEAILSGDFEIIERSKHTVEILVNENRYDIWMANEPETTAIYRLREFGYTDIPEFFGLKFEEPERCREILNAAMDKEKLKEERRQLEQRIKFIDRVLQ